MREMPEMLKQCAQIALPWSSLDPPHRPRPFRALAFARATTWLDSAGPATSVGTTNHAHVRLGVIQSGADARCVRTRRVCQPSVPLSRQARRGRTLDSLSR